MKERIARVHLSEEKTLEVDLEGAEFGLELQNHPDKKIIINTLMRIKEHGFEIGRGRTAQVIALRDDPNSCIKVITDKKISPNNIVVEMDLLTKCRDLDPYKLTGVRVPKPTCTITFGAGKEYNYLIMERIGGDSLKSIIEDNKGIPEYFLAPDVLNKDGKIDKTIFFAKVDNFFEKLKQFIELINQNNIYHRDLHEGNIMIDENGNPAVIDFGDALGEWNPEPYKKMRVDGSVIKWPEDDHALKEVKKKFKYYLLGEIKKKEESL